MEPSIGGGRETLRDVLVDAEHRLQRAGVPSPGVDAAELAAFVLGTTRTRMLLHDPLDAEQRVRYENLIAQRASRVPLQHLTGQAAFRRIELSVGPGVFIPRPETELVAEAAIRTLRVAAPADRIAVDLCSGSGALALSLATEVESAHVHAVELSETASEWLDRNVRAHSADIAARQSDVAVYQTDATTCADPGQPLSALAGRVSVVVTNPPYVPTNATPRDVEVRDFDPPEALYGGVDGLDVIRRLVRTAAVLLRRGGLLVVEHGDEQGTEAGPNGVPGILSAQLSDDELELSTHTPAGQPVWTRVDDRPDLNQKPRFTLATRR